ncbi:MAG: alpha/beta hydrolase, partial [Alphaproteobacteria bacterium]|nr:alpha/beta hydrolase [Alphaproteobacteria bacterium]
RQQTAILGRADSRPDLSGIDCPSLVLAGREDSLIPIEHQVMMAETIVGADLTLLGECGHMAPMERPQAVTRALLGWLEG